MTFAGIFWLDSEEKENVTTVLGEYLIFNDWRGEVSSCTLCQLVCVLVIEVGGGEKDIRDDEAGLIASTDSVRCYGYLVDEGDVGRWLLVVAHVDEETNIDDSNNNDEDEDHQRGCFESEYSGVLSRLRQRQELLPLPSSVHHIFYLIISLSQPSLPTYPPSQSALLLPSYMYLDSGGR